MDTSVLDQEEWRTVIAYSHAHIMLVDEAIGRVLGTLDRLHLTDSTTIIFTADHGDMEGAHNRFDKGPYFYEPAIHVPLIVSWPGRIGPRRATALVELMDLAPTLLDAAGLPHNPGMQGKSLWPLLIGKANGDEHREDIYCEYYNALQRKGDPTVHMTMVRTRRHKLVADHGTGFGELYDLEADPTETHNLWDDPAAAGVKTDMLVRLAARMAQTVDPLPVRRAPW